MVDPIDWDALYAEFLRSRSTVLSGNKPEPFEPSPMVVDRLAHPVEEDTRWLIDALKHEGEPPEGRRWFVTELIQHSNSWAEVFLGPMLNAAVDEVDPSYNRYLVEPCMKIFGPRRVNEYLLRVVESGTDFRKAGAINALYWAQVPLSFPGGAPSFDIQHATHDSRALYESLQDVWERKKRLFLETFVANSSVDVRRSIIPSLDLDSRGYPESHRPLVTQAIELARHHEDEYIRHRVEVQLGDISSRLAPLPHRDKRMRPA